MLCVIIAFSLTCLFGCLHRNELPPAPSPSKVIRWAVQKAPKHMDWTFCQDVTCVQHVSLVMEGLFKAETHEGVLQTKPQLIETWKELSPTKIQIKLKKNVKWTDGKALVANHYTGAWKRLLNHSRRTKHAKLLYPIFNAQPYAEGKVKFDQVGIHSPNPYEIILTLEQITPKFKLRLSHPATWPIRQDTPNLTLGPFTKKPIQKSHRIIYERNDLYHGMPPPVSKIETRIVKDVGHQIHLFLSGETDVIAGISHFHGPIISKNPSHRVLNTYRLLALVANSAQTPLDQSQYRTLFHQNIDRQEANRLMQWAFTPTTTFFPFFRKAPLQLAQTTQSKSPTMFSPKIYVRTSLQKELAQNIRAQWQRKLGIHSSFTKSKKEAHYLIVEANMDPYFALQGLVSLANKAYPVTIQPQAREIERLQFKLATSHSLEQTQQILNAAEKKWSKQFGILTPLLYLSKRALVSTKVKELHWNRLNYWDFSRADIIS